KKGAKSGKTGKKTPKAPSEYDAEADRIIQIWKDAVADGLDGKHFAPAVENTYEPRLRDKILELLEDGRVFDTVAEDNTKAVGHDFGTVCAIMTAGSEVSKDTFQDVFRLMKKHPVCPQPGKVRGAWCDIPL